MGLRNMDQGLCPVELELKVVGLRATVGHQCCRGSNRVRHSVSQESANTRIQLLHGMLTYIAAGQAVGARVCISSYSYVDILIDRHQPIWPDGP